MATFIEANRARLELKMKLSNYSWYTGSSVTTESDGYGVIIIIQHIDNQIRRIIPFTLNGVNIKTETANR